MKVAKSTVSVAVKKLPEFLHNSFAFAAMFYMRISLRFIQLHSS